MIHIEDSMINERYKILKKIDKNIFKCEDRHLEVKSKEFEFNALFFELERSDQLIDSIFLNQINKIKDIKHKNVLRVISGEFVKKVDSTKYEENNAMFIIQEYFTGEPLDRFLLANTLNLQDRVSVVNQLIEGILCLHSLNVVHGNLDTKNIYVLREDDEIIVKVGNYGLNKLNETFYDKKIVSRRKYLEYIEFNDDIDMKNDIYSLSLIVTEILGKYNLFLGEDIESVIESKLNAKYIPMIKEMLFVEDENKGYVVKDFKKIVEEKSVATEDDKKSYKLGLRISHSRLYEENYISSSNYFKAKEFFEEQLKESYITYNKYKKDTFDKKRIIICGKSVQLSCQVDRNNPDMLVVTGLAGKVFKQKIDDIEVMREYALKVDWQWDTSDNGGNNEPLSTLFERIDNHIEKYIKKIDIIETWKAVLKVERENMYESRKKVRYESFSYDKKNEVIFVKVGDDLEDRPYTGKEDEVLVMSSKKDSKKNIKIGKFEDYIEGEIIISVYKDFNEKLIANSGYLQVDTSGLNSLIKRKDSALRSIEKERSVNRNLKSIIQNPKSATAYDRVTSDSIAFIDKRLDDSKKRNIIKSINSEDIFLLQGPPGTGKTTFINELVCQILNKQKNAKILISSQSHVAVDNALDNIAKSIPEVSIIRLGDNSNIAENMKERNIENHAELWIKDISEKSQLALNDFKESVSLSEDVKNRINIIGKIDELSQDIKRMSDILPIKQKELDEIEKVYDSLNNFKDKIQGLSSELKFRESTYSDEYLINKLKSFKSDYLELGNMFISKLEEANSVSKDKEDLENTILDLEGEVEEKNNIIKESKLQLGVKTKTDYEKIKTDIEKDKKEYDKYENISSILGEWQERMATSSEIESEAIKHACIIGATCIEVGKKVYDLEFDWVIVDEAGRATPPEIFVPMTLGKNILLVGDDKQLPPVIEKEIYTKEELKEMGLNKKDLEQSLFAYMGENLPDKCKGMLDKQYRMNPVIGNLISEAFYKGELKSGCEFDAKYHGLDIDEFKDNAITWLTTRNSKKKKEKGTVKGNYYNECELSIIKNYLSKINNDYGKKNITGKSVGIICGYRRQKEILRSNIDCVEYQNLNIDINTVDAFQGRECDIIFYSIVRSNENGDIGFLKDMRRLNVALSRAKELLVIVGDDKCAITKKKIQGEDNPFVAVVEYMQNNSDRCAIKEV